MKSKLADACSLARKLRRKKEELHNKLKLEFNFPNKKYRKLIKKTLKTLGGTANHRHRRVSVRKISET